MKTHYFVVPDFPIAHFLRSSFILLFILLP